MARQRRQAVDHLKSRQFSERRACRLVVFSRSAMWRKLDGREDHELRARLKMLAERYPRYGCPTLHEMLRAKGHVLNHERTERIQPGKPTQNAFVESFNACVAAIS